MAAWIDQQQRRAVRPTPGSTWAHAPLGERDTHAPAFEQSLKAERQGVSAAGSSHFSFVADAGLIAALPLSLASGPKENCRSEARFSATRGVLCEWNGVGLSAPNSNCPVR